MGRKYKIPDAKAGDTWDAKSREELRRRLCLEIKRETETNFAQPETGPGTASESERRTDPETAPWSDRKPGPNALSDLLWNVLIQYQKEPFYTVKGLEFTYYIKGNELFVDRKDKSITRASVDVALRKAMEQKLVVSGPKKLTSFGASYLYPIFLKLGIITQGDPFPNDREKHHADSPISE